MAILQSRLRQYSVTAGTFPRTKLAGQRTAFLCHSHKDQTLALGLQELLWQAGVGLYIDWQDAEMPEKPSAETAQRLKARIQACDVFMFLATQNSMSSKWCPWELGNADGVKRNQQIVVIPTSDGSYTHGAEYMHLYRRIDANSLGTVQVFTPGQSLPDDIRKL